MSEDLEDRFAQGAGSGLFLIIAILTFAGVGWAAKDAITALFGIAFG